MLETEWSKEPPRRHLLTPRRVTGLCQAVCDACGRRTLVAYRWPRLRWLCDPCDAANAVVNR